MLSLRSRRPRPCAHLFHPRRVGWVEIVWLEITDPPDLWREHGFVVDDDGRCVVNGVEHRLGSVGPDGATGVVGWAVSGIETGTGDGGDSAGAGDRGDGGSVGIEGNPGGGAGAGIERGTAGDGGVGRGVVGGGAVSDIATGAGDQAGADRWSDASPGVGDIDGIPTTVVPVQAQRPATPRHPNGVFRIDHLVIRTPDTPRTVAALEAVGNRRRGGRTTNSAGDSVDMTFFWAGDTLLELSGPPEPRPDGGPARLAGIAFATDDLDATVALLGERSTTPVDAVQPGRRIAALNRTAGSAVPTAFMTPHVKR